MPYENIQKTMSLRIRHPQAWILPILITLASFNGLSKAISGDRYGPLIIDAALVALLAANFAERMLRNRLKIGILDLFAAIFIMIAILEVFNPNIPSFQAGLEGFRKFAFMTIGFFIGRYLVNITTLKRLVKALLIGSFIISLYGIKQFMLPSALDYRLIDLSTSSPITYMMGGHIRAFSTMSGPFQLGIYLVCVLLLLLAIWQYYPYRRLWVVVLSAPLLVALIMTVTKSNWAGLLAGALTLLILNSKKPLRLAKRLFSLGFIILGIGFLSLWITSAVPELQTLNDGLHALLNPFDAPTFKFRLDLWNETVIPLMRNSPWFGYGTGSAGEGLGNLFENTSSVYIISHNLYFKVQLELGLLGFLSFFGFLLYTLARIWRIRPHLQSPFTKVVSDWTLAFAVSIAVAGLTGAILDAYPANLIFWLLLGSSTRLLQIHLRAKSDPHQLAGSAPLVKSEAL